MNKRIFIPLFLVSTQLLYPADTSEKLIHTVDTYKLLKTTSAHPDAATQQLEKVLDEADVTFEIRSSSNIVKVTVPSTITTKQIKQIVDLLYKLMVIHDQGFIKVKVNRYMSPEMSFEKCFLNSIFLKILDKTDRSVKLEFIKKYFADLNQIWTKKRHIMPDYTIKSFFTTLLQNYLNQYLYTGSKSFSLTAEARSTILTICQNIYHKEASMNLFSMSPYKPVLRLHHQDWTYTEVDLITKLIASIAELTESLNLAVYGQDQEFFISLFKLYLNKFCWVYRSTGSTYVASRAADSSWTTPPPGRLTVKQIINKDGFKWKDVNVTVPRYAGSNRTKNLNSPKTLTVKKWMTYNYLSS